VAGLSRRGDCGSGPGSPEIVCSSLVATQEARKGPHQGACVPLRRRSECGGLHAADKSIEKKGQLSRIDAIVVRVSSTAVRSRALSP